MNDIPRVYLISSKSLNLSFDKLSRASKKLGFEVEILPRGGDIVNSSELASYNHDTPTFAVINSIEASKKTISTIATKQLNSALDQLFIKALVYSPTVILIAQSTNFVDDYFPYYKDIIISTNSYEDAINQISQLVKLRNNKSKGIT